MVQADVEADVDVEVEGEVEVEVVVIFREVLVKISTCRSSLVDGRWWVCRDGELGRDASTGIRILYSKMLG